MRTCSTPTVMGKMNGGLSTPSHLSDPSSYHHHHHHKQYLDHNDPYNSVSSPESSADAYSPALQQQNLPEQQYLSANDNNTLKCLLPKHLNPPISHIVARPIPEPDLPQADPAGAPPVQQEQHKFLPDALMTSNLGGATSSAPSAVPSMHTTHSQIPTPTLANRLSASLSAMSSSLLGHDHHHHNHQQECDSMEDKAHHHLSSVVELVAASEL
ncbi:hypothetical protein BGZ82_009019 [Podila clonocystis]|nr:hypothetical protein BGZ82_009019 [Podila clonocystis]